MARPMIANKIATKPKYLYGISVEIHPTIIRGMLSARRKYPRKIKDAPFVELVLSVIFPTAGKGQ